MEKKGGRGWTGFALCCVLVQGYHSLASMGRKILLKRTKRIVRRRVVLRGTGALKRLSTTLERHTHRVEQ